MNLTTKKSFHQTTTLNDFEEERRLLTSKIEQGFIQACINLNASIFEPYMEENEVFENKDKYLFLAELKKLFATYQSKSNIFSVKMIERPCLGCSQGKKVVQFIVYSTSDNREVYDFGFVIDTDNNILKDIYRCYQYKESQPYQIKPEGLPAITIRDYICK